MNVRVHFFAWKSGPSSLNIEQCEFSRVLAILAKNNFKNEQFYLLLEANCKFCHFDTSGPAQFPVFVIVLHTSKWKNVGRQMNESMCNQR